MDNSIFATAEHYVSRALDCALAEIEAPGLDTDVFRQQWIEAHRTGDPRTEGRVLQHHFLPINWRWPRLAAFAAMFARVGGDPVMWEGEPCLADPMRTERAILGHYLARLAYLERDFSDRLNEVSSGFSPRDWVVLGGVEDEDNAVAAFVVKCFNQLAADDIRTWPPFYPGCRANIIWYRKSQLDRRGEERSLYPRRKLG